MMHDEHKPNELMELKLKCVSLLLDCPLNSNVPTCPFYKWRAEEVVHRVNWIKSMDTERLKDLLDRHEACLAEKPRR